MTCVPLWYSPVTRVWGYIEAGNETSVGWSPGNETSVEGGLGMNWCGVESWE